MDWPLSASAVPVSAPPPPESEAGGDGGTDGPLLVDVDALGETDGSLLWLGSVEPEGDGETDWLGSAREALADGEADRPSVTGTVCPRGIGWIVVGSLVA